MDKESRKGIVIGLASSTIFLALIQPVLSLGWRWLGAASHSALEGLSNDIYTTAALGPRNWVVVDLAMFGFTIFVSLYSTLIAVLWSSQRFLKDDDSAGEPEVDVEILQNKIVAAQQKVTKYRRITRKLLWVSLSAIICLALVGGFTVFRYKADLRLNTSFSHRLTILTPHIDAQSVNSLRAEWSLMKTRKDYETIIVKMEEHAGRVGISLPEPALK